MRITAKFNGRCAKCGGPTPKGSEIEYRDKTAYHIKCAKETVEPEPSSDPERIADACGFVPSASLEGPGFAAVCADWALWRVREGPVREAAGAGWSRGTRTERGFV